MVIWGHSLGDCHHRWLPLFGHESCHFATEAAKWLQAITAWTCVRRVVSGRTWSAVGQFATCFLLAYEGGDRICSIRVTELLTRCAGIVSWECHELYTAVWTWIVYPLPLLLLRYCLMLSCWDKQTPKRPHFSLLSSQLDELCKSQRVSAHVRQHHSGPITQQCSLGQWHLSFKVFPFCVHMHMEAI